MRNGIAEVAKRSHRLIWALSLFPLEGRERIRQLGDLILNLGTLHAAKILTFSGPNLRQNDLTAKIHEGLEGEIRQKETRYRFMSTLPVAILPDSPNSTVRIPKVHVRVDFF